MGGRTGTALPRCFSIAASAMLLLIPAGGASQAQERSADAGKNTVLVWSGAALQAIHDVQPGPPVAARALAIVHTCMFDAWTQFDEHAMPTQPAKAAKRPVAERTLGNKNEAISFAAYECLTDQFPSRKVYFTALMRKLGYDPSKASTNAEAPAGLGVAAAREVIEFRHHDGANQLGDLNPGAYSDYTGYRASNAPGEVRDVDRWQPLPVPNGAGRLVGQGFVGAQWAKVIPFAMKSGDQFRPPAPASLPLSVLLARRDYQEQAREIVEYTAALTDEQKVIAEYWADGPKTTFPPGHWCTFAEFVSARDKHGVDEDVKMFFVLANALMDAGIAAWDAKRAYDSVRPITAIRYLFAGEKIRGWAGPGMDNVEMLGRDWHPYQDVTAPTPPFPEFFSGHSTFSAAGAEVLSRFTGSDAFGMRVTIPAGSTRIEPGITPKTNVTLSWRTFSDAADQAGISRRYGGIHFKDGDLAGREVGRKVGAAAWAKAEQYFRVTGAPAAAQSGAAKGAPSWFTTSPPATAPASTQPESAGDVPRWFTTGPGAARPEPANDVPRWFTTSSGAARPEPTNEAPRWFTTGSAAAAPATAAQPQPAGDVPRWFTNGPAAVAPAAAAQPAPAGDTPRWFTATQSE